jgi:hypothetical protein
MNRLNLLKSITNPWPLALPACRPFLVKEASGDTAVCIRGDKEVLLFRAERTTYCAFDAWFKNNYLFVRYLDPAESVEVKGTDK